MRRAEGEHQRRGGPGFASQHPIGEREHGGGEDEVQRQEQKRLLVSDLDRNPEGRDGEKRDRDDGRVPDERDRPEPGSRHADTDERKTLGLREEQPKIVVANKRAPETGSAEAEQREAEEGQCAPAWEEYEHGAERSEERGYLGGVRVLHSPNLSWGNPWFPHEPPPSRVSQSLAACLPAGKAGLRPPHRVARLNVCRTGRNSVMIDGFRRALVLAPHTDDGELGCGGTMARLVEAGCEVRYVAFSIATRSLPPGFEPDTLAREVRQATAELGIPEERLTVHDFDVRTFPERRQDILELLVALWEEWRPEIVFQPSHHDVHQDHQTIANEGLRAFKRTTILGYEVPWNNFDFSYGAYISLEKRHIERKVAALSRYASQQHRRYADPEYVWNLARVHGVNVNREYAECFQVYRIVA